jgi:hypothetical protein
VLGGGFVNTELRELTEPRVFDFFDFVTLDAGERPLAGAAGTPARPALGAAPGAHLPAVDGAVRYVNFVEPDVPFDEVGTPTWDGLPLGKYLSLLDMLNPMHRLWSDGRWNKLTVAHGCYWKKCSFCDVSLDYISRYDAASAGTLVDRIEAIVAETGQTGFHFVDEAAPPKSLKAWPPSCSARQRGHQLVGQHPLRKELHARAVPAAGRQRLHRHQRRAGGGLRPPAGADEKGRLGGPGGACDQGLCRCRHPGACLPDVRLSHADRAGHGGRAGNVRQLFAEGCIHSGFWHRFACTVHSPVGQDPQAYGVTLLPLPPVSFAKNDIGLHRPHRRRP